MPIFLIHGFRWERNDLRRFVAAEDVLDAAPDYTMSTFSNKAMVNALRRSYRPLLAQLPKLTLVESYDPDDDSAEIAEPYAYVADTIIRQDKAINASDVINHGPALKPEGWIAMCDLRDILAKDEQIGWWVIYNGDPERADWGPESNSWEEDEEIKGEEKIEKKDHIVQPTRPQALEVGPAESASSGNQTQHDFDSQKPKQKKFSGIKSLFMGAGSSQASTRSSSSRTLA